MASSHSLPTQKMSFRKKSEQEQNFKEGVQEARIKQGGSHNCFPGNTEVHNDLSFKINRGGDVICGNLIE